MNKVYYFSTTTRNGVNTKVSVKERTVLKETDKRIYFSDHEYPSYIDNRVLAEVEERFGDMSMYSYSNSIDSFINKCVGIIESKISNAEEQINKLKSSKDALTSQLTK